MKLLKPVTFVSTMIVASNATEAYAAWSAGTTYAKDAIVDYDTHYYISLVNSNTGNVPDAAGSTFWAFVSSDNKHAMFDRQVSTQTTRSSSLSTTIQVTPSYVDSIALLNITGSEVQVIVTDNGASPPIYNQTFDLETSIITSWYEYFFEPFVLRDQLVVTNLPLRENAEITVTVTGTGTVGIGEFIFGSIYTLGEFGTELGATIGIIDYSRKDTDPDTGVVTFTERAYSKRMSASFYLDNTSLKATQKILADVRAVPSVYIGSDDPTYDPLVIYGFYRDFSIDISYPTRSLCRLEIEGLI